MAFPNRSGRASLPPLAAGLLAALVSAHAAAAPPDLSGTVPIFEERFADGLSRFDGRRGLWSTLGRRQVLMTNAAETVFLDRGVMPPGIDAELPPLHVVTEDGLSLRTVPLSEDARAAVGDYLRRSGQGGRADKVRFATAQITTAETWAQTYGWFEIEARIPRGRGRWPAFWLTFAGRGWPPEIDIFEAYGAGIAQPTPKDATFNTAVIFDAFDETGAAVHDTDLVNRFDPDPVARIPRAKTRGDRDVFTLSRQHDAPGIYDAFHVWAALWTPEEIVFFFGPDRAGLREIYRMPTPADVRAPMHVIANDQFTARGGWWPADRAIEAVLAPENDFAIRSITLRALRPALVLDMARGDAPFDPRDSVIRDTGGDDIIAPGAGFDLVELSGGADEIRIARGRENKIIAGFGPDDRLVLDGFPFASAEDALSRLTQVGPDLWLTAPADPFWPQTVILRDTAAADLTPDQVRPRWPVGTDIRAARADLSDAPERDGDRDGVVTAQPIGSRFKDDGRGMRFAGGPGPDRYIIANPETVILEPADGGVDELIAWGAHALPLHVERGVLRGGGGALTGSRGDDRLEAEGRRLTLSGGAGDDLYVIAPDARAVTISIAEGAGHDVLRGWGDGHRLELAAALVAEGLARVEPAPEGARLVFSPMQSLTLEGASVAEAKAALEAATLQ
ncbi:LamG domain-containing protein [Jannaschia ovalis]|uniref:Family 16 glycosylhydrolase n=1 Tax=Jannaschia ovalis TaxID=3038773 RepID=A0ABY8LFG3_9RHOB|nr:family 16 glycosylhydrolase [Jannaschia sp. GRR-S6-38]WGH78928.1 family 16 glycosylhydrolase [Jannaschia sp. GRR-S6-38]